MICWFLCDRFPVDDRGTVKTVVQYFMETYGFSIQHTTLPCLQVGNQQRPNYLPMEVSVLNCGLPLSPLNLDLLYSACLFEWSLNATSSFSIIVSDYGFEIYNFRFAR
jgi:hypothetical protein